jgi:hypothetical protein
MSDPKETFAEEMLRLPAEARDEEIERDLGVGRFAPPPRMSIAEGLTLRPSPLGEKDPDYSYRLRPVDPKRLEDEDVGKPYDTNEADIPAPSGFSVGVGKGTLMMGEAIWNAADALDDLVSFQKDGKGVLSPTTFASDIQVADDFATGAGEALTTFAASMALGVKATSVLSNSKGFQLIGGLAAGAGIDAILQDPTKGRLTDQLIKEAPHLKAVMAFLATNEEDSYGVAMGKSAMESIGLGFGAHRVFLGTMGVVRGAKKYRAGIKEFRKTEIDKIAAERLSKEAEERATE